MIKKVEKLDDSGLSKNHSKSVKYRIRLQQQKEAEQEIKEYEDCANPSEPDRQDGLRPERS